MNLDDLHNYFFDDKDVFDAIFTEKSLSQTQLLGFLRSKGVFFHANESRSVLCHYIATWFNDYSSLSELSLGVKMKKVRAKFTSEEIRLNDQAGGISENDLEAALDDLKKKVEGAGGALVLEQTAGHSGYEATWIRKETDLSKTPLKQQVERSDRIRIDRTADGGLFVRTPADGGGSHLRDQLTASLETTAKTKVDRFSIHLPDNATPEVRISFFMTILTDIAELSSPIVTGISLLSKKPDQEKDDAEIASDDEDDFSFKKLLSAKLEGGNLLESPEYKYLIDRGFSPREIRWWAVWKSTKEMVSLSVGFSDEKGTSDFFCNIHGIRRVSSSSNELKRTVESVSKVEQNRLMNLLEGKAREISKQQLNLCPADWLSPTKEEEASEETQP